MEMSGGGSLDARTSTSSCSKSSSSCRLPLHQRTRLGVPELARTPVELARARRILGDAQTFEVDRTQQRAGVALVARAAALEEDARRARVGRSADAVEQQCAERGASRQI